MKIGKIPRWYQDLSIHQMELITSLKNVIRADYEENVTGKSKKILMDIGITSTFVKISSKEIRKLQIKSSLDPVKYLCEIYKFITGLYFQDEPYRKSYSCNERIILTSIAFLKLPEILLELHRRLPMGKIQECPKKPSSPKFITRVKKTGSPYLDSAFSEPPDWGLYKSNLQKWYEIRKSQIQPQIILPQCLQIENNYLENDDVGNSLPTSSSFVTVTTEKSQQEITSSFVTVTTKKSQQENPEIDDSIYDEIKKKSNGEISKTTGAPSSSLTIVVSKIDEENLIDNKINEKKKDKIVLKKLKKQKIIKNNNDDDDIKEKSIDKIYKKKDQQNINENIENLKQKKQKNKVINENVQNKITEKNSLEKYDYLYKRLSRLDNYEKKIFPPGKENLSLKWQEWFINVETEFYYLEKVANKMIDNVREITQKIFPVDVCDGCCACRQQNKFKKNYRESKIPNIVIDNITTGETGKRYIVNSLVLNSPPESLSGSSINEPFVVPSEDKLVNKSIINSVIMQNNKTKYQMSGITKQMQHIPRRLIPKVPIIKNIAPCECKNEERSLEFYENQKLTCTDEDEDVCIGEKITTMTCRECADKFKNNEIFIKFEKICRQNDKKYEEEMERIKLARQPKQPPEEITIVNKIDEEIIKCKKCIGCDEDKCKPNPFDNLLKQKNLVNEEILIDGKKYRDNIKISVGGSINNDDGKINCFILSGISLQTPIEVTPEPSEPDVESIKSMSKHHHWSVTKFYPKYQKEIEDNYVTDEMIIDDDDTIKTINNEKIKSDIVSLNNKEIHEYSKITRIKKNTELKNHDDNIHNKEKKKDNHKHKKKIDKDLKKASKEEQKSSLNSSIKDEMIIRKNDFKEKENILNDNINDEIKKNEFKEKVNFLDNNIDEEIKTNEFKDNKTFLNDNKNEEIQKNNTIENLKINSINKITDNSNLFKENNNDVGDGNLSTMMKIALDEMAEEGYLFAKLPACHEIPPLKIWIMYRKGFKTSDKKNNEYLENMEKLFDSSDKDPSNKLEAPPLKLSDDKKKKLNHKTLSKLAKKIEIKKNKFFSDTRKHRVNESRKMWNLLEQGQVPCATDKFKKIFFTYQPSKESEGFILKPYGFESE